MSVCWLVGLFMLLSENLSFFRLTETDVLFIFLKHELKFKNKKSKILLVIRTYDSSRKKTTRGQRSVVEMLGT